MAFAFIQAVIFAYKNTPHKCLTANFPTILWNQFHQKSLKPQQQPSCNRHHQEQKRNILFTAWISQKKKTRNLLVAHQSWMVGCSPHPLKLSRRNYISSRKFKPFIINLNQSWKSWLVIIIHLYRSYDILDLS